MTSADEATAAHYRRFAAEEAHGKSPLYETFALGVAADPDILTFLGTLPPPKRQPNLLLAAVRHRFGTAATWAGFRESLLGDPDPVRAIMLTHATQTNEPGRCAVLLPVLASLPQPLALIEVGASAGLCLLPDHYGYDYGPTKLRPPSPHHPVFPCSVSAATPVPALLPRIAWRAGLDLNPLNVADPAHSAWLENLVWPEQTDRLARLRAAMTVAREIKPRVRQGDLLGDDLGRLCAEAPKDATLVIFHTAVLAYVADRSEREAFAARAMALAPFWVSNEGPRVFPGIAGRTATGRVPGRCLLSVNGAPVAWTDPHGAAMEWIAAEDPR